MGVDLSEGGVLVGIRVGRGVGGVGFGVGWAEFVWGGVYVAGVLGGDQHHLEEQGLQAPPGVVNALPPPRYGFDQLCAERLPRCAGPRIRRRRRRRRAAPARRAPRGFVAWGGLESERVANDEEGGRTRKR